jgi:2-polyprenyl-3-methyl-5-hydroxy-6-metoxy-1,4-benzoquinol methylase
MSAPAMLSVEARAAKTRGSSNDAIYRMVGRALASRDIGGHRLLDVGCGRGGLWGVLGSRFEEYCGVDVVRYPGFPPDARFHQVDLDSVVWPVERGAADVVAAVETIEHLENPWAFMRTLAALARPGGWVVVTTPNQLSALSLATLIVKRRFSSFQDVHYPAHRTALLEVDLRRLAEESGLESVELHYSLAGRLPLTPWHYPARLTAAFPRALSDNVLMVGRTAIAPRP